VANVHTESVRIWDTRTGELLRDFADPKIGGRPIALSPDGSILATGGKTVKLWDAETGEPIRELFGWMKKTQAIAFSPDGRFLVGGGSYGTTNLWEVGTGRHAVTLIAFPDDRNESLREDWAAFTPEGPYDGSEGVDRFLAWRVGDDFVTAETLGATLRNPERVREALAPLYEVGFSRSQPPGSP
jgi:WD40 repeat protein